jgi:hypothetical protein
MKAFANKTKPVAAMVASAAALTGAATALTGPATAHGAAANPNLDVRVVALGHVRGFWAANCPLAFGNATAWAQGDDAEASALHREGFAVGVRELLRSNSGDSGVSVALRFRAASGAAADLKRRELEAGHEGYATSFAVPDAPSVHAYTVRAKGTATVHVAFTRGADEYAIAVETTNGEVGALQHALAAAARREAPDA